MAPITNLHGLSKTLAPIVTCLPNAHRNLHLNKRVQIVGSNNNTAHESESSSQESVVDTTTRRAAIGLVASIVLTAQFHDKISLAQEHTHNGWWYDDLPLPLPTVTNNLANEKTGTRSFIKKGIYMADIGVKGSVYRIKKYAFDLLAMADLIAADTLNYVRRYLRIKSTFMYYDFDKVISAMPVDNKQQLTDIANKLFDNFEKLEEASRRKSLPDTQSIYQETEVMLHDVMDRMDVMYKTI
ncbi:photosynthetic NDH subunit of lumenal location 3, chloroplastic [Arachis stenosperma]|uniref:photosynthetic NDH subunit of lumenal location 3, chloroplastic n=1 Tax=Arachis stenosperma TaxID=217475 RepID=UPI0025AC9097|nr:photosynthetic NDH subunit of lumenal location 3, chloroplastic [Arachis stenosperma]